MKIKRKKKKEIGKEKKNKNKIRIDKEGTITACFSLEYKTASEVPTHPHHVGHLHSPISLMIISTCTLHLCPITHMKNNDNSIS